MTNDQASMATGSATQPIRWSLAITPYDCPLTRSRPQVIVAHCTFPCLSTLNPRPAAMPLWEIILLGVIQGLTEFLPVSSSGHLVVANALLEALGSEPVEDLIEVSIVLHLGTLVAVLAFYRREIVRLLGIDRRAIPLLVVGTIPAVIFGLLIKKGPFEGLEKLILENPLVAGLMFPVTAAALLWVSRREPGDTDYPQLTWQRSLVIGLMQAVAILPGISYDRRRPGRRAKPTSVGDLRVFARYSRHRRGRAARSR